MIRKMYVNSLLWKTTIIVDHFFAKSYDISDTGKPVPFLCEKQIAGPLGASLSSQKHECVFVSDASSMGTGSPSMNIVPRRLTPSTHSRFKRPKGQRMFRRRVLALRPNTRWDVYHPIRRVLLRRLR